MQVNVRLYYNTGFNTIDTPANSNVIEDLALDFIDVPNIYVVQNRGLTSIRIPITYENAVKIEYIRLTDTTTYNNVVYYMVLSTPSMLNENSAEFRIEEDFITTCNIDQADILSGQINVAHVPVDDWRYAQVPEDRFSPPGILELKQQELDSAFIKGSEDNTMKTIMNSTIDPVATAKNEYAVLNTGYAALDPTHSGNIHVAVPKVERPTVDFKTQYVMKRLSSVGTTVSRDYYPPYYSYFLESKDVDLAVYTKEQDTLNFIRSLGLFDSIIAMYDVNNVYIQTFNYTAVNNETRTLQLDNNTSKTFNLGEEKLTKAEPIFKYFNNNLNAIFNFEYANGYTPKNKKVYAGDNNKYILVSKSTGSKIEINPEDCMELLNNAPSTTQPSLIITADLRAGGAPKALFRYMYNGANSGMMGVNGMSWANHQNNYFGQYGTEIANNSFRMGASQNIQNTMYKSIGNYAGVVSGLGQSLVGVGQTGLGLIGVGGTQNIGAALTGGMSGGVDVNLQGIPVIGNQVYNANAGTLRSGLGNYTAGLGKAIGSLYNEAGNELNYRQRKAQLDYANMMATGATKAPVVEFPFSESSREIFGNYFTIYRTVYTAQQMKQMDDFYTMWGYKVGGIDINGETADWLFNRKYFNYISMTNVSVKLTDHPMYEREGIASQLANKRLWKILPKDWNITMGNPIATT